MQAIRSFLHIIIVALIFGSVNLLLQSIVYQDNNFNTAKNISHVTNHTFWYSSLGLGLKALIDMSVISCLIFCCTFSVPFRTQFRSIAKCVSLAYLVFLLQMIVEAVLIKKNEANILNEDIGEFAFLSIFYFAKMFEFKVIPAFHYLTQTISVFEIFFWVSLALLFSKLLRLRLSTSAMLVCVGYILPLFIWLFSISFLVLVNIK